MTAPVLRRPLARHTGVIAGARDGNGVSLRSVAMAVPSPRRERSPREQEVRRLRDLLRTAVLAERITGQLPSESELMAGYGATRSTVREALAMLRVEGLVERLPGVGTHAVIGPPTTSMDEALGVVAEGEMLDAATRPRVLDRSTLAAPGALAAWLQVPPGTPCLRLEYVAMQDGGPAAVATNYVLYPEAERLVATSFRGHWYTLLADAGLVLGESEFVMDCVQADPVTAALLETAPGVPLLAMEQAISDPSGRRFNVAILRIRPDRFRFVSRASALAPRSF
ncbi:GntR family transcriptional regulator [Pseudonocardia sp. GCM10023141]|uniref:GntR family transcriptional regulator n=1 Tax=Pseudonocardia sp. GCM10023141 TaxID=3252653 RepID=UPI003619C5BC